MPGIENLKLGIQGVFTIVRGGVRIAKNAKAIVEEARDLQIDEIIGLVTLVATQEVPLLIEEFKK